MRFFVHEPLLAEDMRRHFEEIHPEWPYEMWDGDFVVAPLADNEHRDVQLHLMLAVRSCVARERGDRQFMTCNVSDRNEGWENNYRNPDGLVYLCGNPAVDRDTHMQGGPDLAVEILSGREDPYAKLPFYAAVGTRELLIVFRDPWRLELWRPTDGVMQLAAAAGVDCPAISSGVLPITFRIGDGKRRPRLVVAHATTGRELPS